MQGRLSLISEDVPSTGEAEGPRRKVLYVLDAFSLIYQVFHAIPQMTGPAGLGARGASSRARVTPKPDLVASIGDSQN